MDFFYLFKKMFLGNSLLENVFVFVVTIMILFVECFLQSLVLFCGNFFIALLKSSFRYLLY